MKYARFALAFVLAACQSAPVAPWLSGRGTDLSPAARGTPRRAHLYISVSTATHHPSIERFGLNDGIPEAKPDRVYDGYGGLLAVAGDGTLYVGDISYDVAVGVFPPKSDKPAREIILPDIARRCGLGSGRSTVVSAVAADAAGHLFVGVETYSQLHRYRPSAEPRDPKSPWPCEGVAVYAPGANGKARPIAVIRYPEPSYVEGLAVDASDDLFVDDSPYEVDEFANAVHKPQKTRVFRSGYTGYIHSVAVNSAGDLFIASTDSSYKTGRIERYAPNADGYGKPTSTVVLPIGVHLLESIAARQRVLYVNDVNTGVDLYHALKDGNQSPFYSLTASNVLSLATDR